MSRRADLRFLGLQLPPLSLNNHGLATYGVLRKSSPTNTSSRKRHWGQSDLKKPICIGGCIHTLFPRPRFGAQTGKRWPAATGLK
jgi:hypothetical protein